MEIHNNNEFQIQLYMSKKFGDAFKYAHNAETEGLKEWNNNFPPTLFTIGDYVEDQVDAELFLEQFKEVVTTLSKGSRLSKGDFE
jgi:hypothetical protein|tara:strand:- start:206 stop:460 length:255 start_codon:yes stop_codon:yes gene_type:complete